MSSHSKKILKKLGQKAVLPLAEIAEPGKYELTRSLKNLVEAGYADIRESDNQKYARLTQKGRSKLNTLLLEGEDALVPLSWDGFWRIIILDLPEDRKQERESLRYLLKKAGFVCVKNTVWISPHPYENLFTNIKKDLGLSTELMIIVTQFIDKETKKVLFQSFKK